MIYLFARRLVFNVLFVALVYTTTFSQGLEIGAGLGGSLYWGDLSASVASENFGNLRLGGQIYLRHTYTESFSLRANLLLTRLAGDDALSSAEGRNRRNLSFFSDLYELGLIAEFDFLKFDIGGRYHGLKFYIMGGASVFRFNPKTEYQGSTYELQPLGTEGQGMPGFEEPYSLTQFGIPLGGGMKIKISDNLTLNPELAFRLTFTDHIDDVSSNFYVNYNELRAGNGELAANLANRIAEGLGQSEPNMIPTGTVPRGGAANDYYFTGMIHLTYRFNDYFDIFKKRGGYYIKCPEF